MCLLWAHQARQATRVNKCCMGALKSLPSLHALQRQSSTLRNHGDPAPGSLPPKSSLACKTLRERRPRSHGLADPATLRSLEVRHAACLPRELPSLPVSVLRPLRALPLREVHHSAQRNSLRAPAREGAAAAAGLPLLPPPASQQSARRPLPLLLPSFARSHASCLALNALLHPRHALLHPRRQQQRHHVHAAEARSRGGPGRAAAQRDAVCGRLPCCARGALRAGLPAEAAGLSGTQQP